MVAMWIPSLGRGGWDWKRGLGERTRKLACSTHPPDLVNDTTQPFHPISPSFSDFMNVNIAWVDKKDCADNVPSHLCSPACCLKDIVVLLKLEYRGITLRTRHCNAEQAANLYLVHVANS